ncbi:MAG: helix-turn-helix domain-containing protein, partial [Rubrobacteraceae bacterium]|nr:helix-turn-helix domain-containing protein [Rubrobacteraceae bacterium]
MKRPIYVRPLSDAERNALEAGLRSPDAFTLRRCQILLASADGQNAYQIAHNLGCNPQTARNAIHSFNEEGLQEALRRGSNWGAPISPDSSISQLLWRSDVELHPDRGG